jgi:hypothetical protein
MLTGEKALHGIALTVRDWQLPSACQALSLAGPTEPSANMDQLTALHAIGFILYFVILLAGPVIWYRRGELILRSARRLGVESDS